MSQSAYLKLETAQGIAAQVVEKLHPHCERIEIAGSIRRRRPLVHDIDLVCIPGNQGAFLVALQSLGRVTGGEKLIKVYLAATTLDVYIARPETWPTLLLIRTGSAKHNVMMCQRARQFGLIVHADGRGLCNLGEDSPLSGINTEADIFSELKMHYKQPWEREV